MVDAMAGLDLARRVRIRRTLAVLACVGACIFVYYWGLLSDARFLNATPVRLGLTYNSMMEYMARGRFDIDPAIIQFEGFTHDGRTYAYFGIMPAFLRFPILIFPHLSSVDFTVVSCAIAATLAALVKLVTIRRASLVIGDSPYKRTIIVCAMAIVVFGGAQVQFARPLIYQESLYWASAISALFVLMAFRWCVDVPGRRPLYLVMMAVLAGVCLLTRVSTSLGLYAGCGFIMLSELIAASRGGEGSLSVRLARVISRVILPSSLVLILFMTICGYVNYARWGSPLTFQDYRYYNLIKSDDPVFEVIRHYGYFSFERIPFGLSYYFLPIWTIVGSDGHFLFRDVQDRMLFFAEFPPATFFASDMFLCFLAVLGCVWLSRGSPSRIDRATARLLAVGFAIPGVLMLMAIAMTFRYRLEFYQFFEFLALFGLFYLAEKIVRRPRLLVTVCVVMVVVSVVSAHVFLIGYKLTKGGNVFGIEKSGWTAEIRSLFHDAYPSIDRLFRGN